MTDTPEIKTAPKKTRGQKFLTIFKYGGLPLTILSGIIFSLIILYVYIFVFLIADVFQSVEQNVSISNTVLIGFMIPFLLAPFVLVGLSAILQVLVALYSFVHVLLRFILNRKVKRKPIAIIFRILTLLFGIGSIVSIVLLVTQSVPVYDYLRLFLLFCGGSVVLNLTVE